MPQRHKNSLDTIRRGRPREVRFQEVLNRSANYRGIFGRPGLWARLWPHLKGAQGKDDITHAFHEESVPDVHEFVPSLTALILRVVREPGFPKKHQQAQINYLADSLAGRGRVEPRRSRDICGAERARAEKAHRILRYEFYVECSCGYKGPARNDACAHCGAPIIVGPE